MNCDSSPLSASVSFIWKTGIVRKREEPATWEAHGECELSLLPSIPLSQHWEKSLENAPEFHKYNCPCYWGISKHFVQVGSLAWTPSPVANCLHLYRGVQLDLRLNLGSPHAHTHPQSFPRTSPKFTQNSRSQSPPLLPFLADPQIQSLSKSYGPHLHSPTRRPRHVIISHPLSPSLSHHPLSSPNWCLLLPHQSRNHLLKMGIRSHRFRAPNCPTDVTTEKTPLVPYRNVAPVSLLPPHHLASWDPAVLASGFSCKPPSSFTRQSLYSGASLHQQCTSSRLPVVCPSLHSGLCFLNGRAILSSPTPCPHAIRQ